MKTTEIRIGKDIFKIKMTKGWANIGVEWCAYRHRSQKKWWQISYWEFFPFTDGWVINPHSMDDVIKEVADDISKEILKKEHKSVFEKEWDNF